ncbi:sugar O-acetyltransferase [Streptococcus oricebi]|uniref:Acetyltransferase n=1 Tax=Streptococcus oricebi TaxID=1547447 RepID=A0ABS5B2D9_9STRE|nr:sugar O-acetyltransferase [Streptococcus oricebi]MBP2622676.1 maltose acetyltransferase [Streptococcus oricebi]
MSQKEKMLAGQLYYAEDQVLSEERKRAKEICYDYNLLRPSQEEEQQVLLKQLLGKMESPVTITAPFWCDYGYNIELGENFYSNHNLVILDGAKVRFGSNVFVGPNCGFHTAGHPLDQNERNQGLEYAYPIEVGHSVWFGAGVQVMPGVSIGDDVVIAAGSVVTKDLPSHVLAAGVPCKVIRPLKDSDRQPKD